jgi:hypothetical protein
MKLIDSDTILEALGAFSGGDPHFLNGIASAREIIEGMPEAVVRCKDCKWRDDYGCALRIVDESDKPGDNDFCSFGERRTDEA